MIKSPDGCLTISDYPPLSRSALPTAASWRGLRLAGPLPQAAGPMSSPSPQLGKLSLQTPACFTSSPLQGCSHPLLHKSLLPTLYKISATQSPSPASVSSIVVIMIYYLPIVWQSPAPHWDASFMRVELFVFFFPSVELRRVLSNSRPSVNVY